jgi:arabinofuranan 3-O-arabinosyltransferase
VLKPITVNGWQQGWVLPAGTSGMVALDFKSNTTYRVGLFGGLALLPLLLLLGLLPVRHEPARQEPARPWQPGPFGAGAAVLAVGFLVSGFVGIAVVGVAIGLRHLLRGRQRLSDALTLGAGSGGLILAGAVLSQYPWRSVDGYIGHAWGVQLLALISVATLAASVVPSSRAGEPALDEIGTSADPA